MVTVYASTTGASDEMADESSASYAAEDDKTLAMMGVAKTIEAVCIFSRVFVCRILISSRLG